MPRFAASDNSKWICPPQTIPFPLRRPLRGIRASTSLRRISMERFSWILSAAGRAGHVSQCGRIEDERRDLEKYPPRAETDVVFHVIEPPVRPFGRHLNRRCSNGHLSPWKRRKWKSSVEKLLERPKRDNVEFQGPISRLGRRMTRQKINLIYHNVLQVISIS